MLQLFALAAILKFGARNNVNKIEFYLLLKIIFAGHARWTLTAIHKHCLQLNAYKWLQKASQRELADHDGESGEIAANNKTCYHKP